MRAIFPLFGLILVAGACGSQDQVSECPTSVPVSCSTSGRSWCCGTDATCGPTAPECVLKDHPCPATSPLLCNPGAPIAQCCPTGTRCVPTSDVYVCETDSALGGTGGLGAGGSAGSAAPQGGMANSACAERCGDTCCDATAKCLFNNPVPVCRKRCATSSDCPTDTPCCDESTNVCRPGSEAKQCICTTGAECESGSCAPSTDASFATPPQVTGPYICKPKDGKRYDGCGGLTFCESGTCCFADSKGNQFCAEPCTSASECGSAAACVQYDASHTSCLGDRGCGVP